MEQAYACRESQQVFKRIYSLEQAQAVLLTSLWMIVQLCDRPKIKGTEENTR